MKIPILVTRREWVDVLGGVTTGKELDQKAEEEFALHGSNKAYGTYVTEFHVDCDMLIELFGDSE